MNYLALYLKTCIRANFQKFIKDERGEVNIIATVVLIGIAVSLAVIFKNEITKLLTDLIEAIFGKKDEILN